MKAGFYRKTGLSPRQKPDRGGERMPVVGTPEAGEVGIDEMEEMKDRKRAGSTRSGRYLVDPPSSPYLP
jgi:hypothetical protein